MIQIYPNWSNMVQNQPKKCPNGSGIPSSPGLVLFDTPIVWLGYEGSVILIGPQQFGGLKGCQDMVGHQWIGICNVLHDLELYCDVLWCTILDYTLLHCSEMYCTGIFCNVRHCTVLFNTIMKLTPVNHCTVE